MKLRKMIAAFTIGTSLLLGGCMNMDGSNHDSSQKSNEAKNGEEQHNNKDIYVSVQDYTGQQYQLPNGEENDKIAKAHQDEIEKAVKKFFLDKYKTKVKVHNIVGNKDGASVYVESKSEPHFHTFVIVPIDIDNKKVQTNQIWSQEGEVEGAIQDGIYGMIFDNNLQKLDAYLKKISNQYPVVGMREEAIDNVRATGYTTPYYYVTVYDKKFESLYKKYLKHPNMTKKEWRKTLNLADVDPTQFLITIHLYMKDPDTKPDKKIFNMIISDIQKKEGFPPGSYSLYLNDNDVNKTTGNGTKKDTLKRSNPNYIVKSLE